eukprot:scaffold8226_cov286-Pinguiococcus_pyrenoidosus.AAC.3
MRFRVGSQVRARILMVDEKARKLQLTMKQSLVKVEDSELITSYDQCEAGERPALGLAMRQLEWPLSSILTSASNGYLGCREGRNRVCVQGSRCRSHRHILWQRTWIHQCEETTARRR